jgi:LTXXQ motif family protein
MNFRTSGRMGVLAAFICGAMLAMPAKSQQIRPAAPDSSIVLIPGTLTGPGSMGPRGARRFCNPRSVGLAEWRAVAIIRMLSLDDAQKTALNELSGPSVKALELIASACPKTNADKPPLAVMETRVQTMLQVLRTVRPAYEKFYASLNDIQKRRVDALGPSRHGWQW